ncbi:MAG: FtsQ-type POTRA domain-containing protein [Actinomycetaceae bacterium]|nr:FtsQ-type POTRA domain-containing protein [Actinomycetaceae bacterium]
MARPRRPRITTSSQKIKTEAKSKSGLRPADALASSQQSLQVQAIKDRSKVEPRTTYASKTSSQTAPSTTVTYSFKERLEQRKRSVRRRRLIWLGSFLGIGVALGGVIWALLFSPLCELDKDQIRLKGEFNRVSEKDVRERLHDLQGRSLFLLTNSAVEQQLMDIAWIKHSEVEWNFPHGMTVTLSEKKPVAVVRVKQQLYLTDTHATLLPIVKEDDKQFPLIIIKGTHNSHADLDSGLHILKILKDPVLSRLEDITVQKTQLVTLHLSGGVVIEWGDDDDNDMKMKVLHTLLQRSASVYDVSDPIHPVTS